MCNASHAVSPPLTHTHTGPHDLMMQHTHFVLWAAGAAGGVRVRGTGKLCQPDGDTEFESTAGSSVGQPRDSSCPSSDKEPWTWYLRTLFAGRSF